MKPPLLLHICCGPCALHVIDLLAPRFALGGFFYNPNIHPPEEHDLRRAELVRIAADRGLDLECAEYDYDRWFAAVRGLEQEPERGRRCEVCIRLRLERTFAAARAGGFAAVATTLAIGRLKSTAQVNRLGLEIAANGPVIFLAENFKRHGGVEIARDKARALAVRRQSYCGCIYSRPPSPSSR